MSKLIPLSKNKNAVVDDSLYNLISKHKWYYLNGYASRDVRMNKKRVCILRMHKAVLLATGNFIRGMEIDHINGDKLDNRRSNLRCCTRSENNSNANTKRGKSGYRGVYWHNRDQLWFVMISKDGKKHYGGKFKSKRKAALVYNKLARELHGEFAKLNTF